MEKREFLKKYREILFTVLGVFGTVAAMWLFQQMKLPLVVTNVFFVAAGFLIMSYWWKKTSENRSELWIIQAAFAARVLICFLDVYAVDYIDIPFTGGDSVGYWKTAVQYFHGNYEKFYTYYPYVILGILKFAGLNRFAAQFFNVLCWGVCTVLIQKSCRLLEIKGGLRTAAVALYSFMPVNLIYTSSLMREAIPALAMLCLFYGILKWMKDGKYGSLIFLTVISAPGFLLHNSMVVIWAVMILVLVFYSPAKQKFCLEKKSFYFFGAGLLGIAVIAFALSQGIVAIQIPDFSNGIFSAINERLESFYRNYGGSTYLLNEYVYDYPSLFTGTIKRMIYFFCAPFPLFWRGMGDCAAFFMGAGIYIFSVVAAAVSLFAKKKDPYRFVMALTMFFVCGIFAWMVSNSGTAMRHREKFLGLAVLLGIYSVKLIMEKKRHLPKN